MLRALILAMLLGGVSSAQPSKLPKDLIQYVSAAKDLGLKEGQIQENAVRAGWSADDIKDALQYMSAAAAAPKADAVAPGAAKADGAAPGGASEAPRPPKARGVPDEYRIGEGDIVQVSVWRQPEASVESAVVRPDGKVSMPLIKEFPIAGLTPIQAEKAIGQQLSTFIDVPDIAVVVREIHSKKVYIVGAVNKPGPLPYTYQMTVLQAISEVGGLTDYAKRKKIYVLRSQDGKQYKLPFNYDAALKGQQMELNIQLQPGDTLVAPN